MKLTNLRALVAAIEEGSLRSAGKRLGISQPALTKLIRELERELSTTLLHRSTTGVVATAQGLVMYERAIAADRELVQAVEQIRQLDGHMSGSLTIGAVPLAVMLLVPETLRTFGSAFPDIKLRIIEELYIAQLTRLRKGEVDIALGPLPNDLPAGEFAVETLMPITMVVVVRKGNPLARAKSLADLAVCVMQGRDPEDVDEDMNLVGELMASSGFYGMAVKFGTPVRYFHSESSCSSGWGSYYTQWVYAESFEAAWELGVAWAEKSAADDLAKFKAESKDGKNGGAA